MRNAIVILAAAAILPLALDSGTGLAAQTTPVAAGGLKEKFVDLGPYMVAVNQKIKTNWHAPANPKFVVVRWQIAADGTMSGLKVDKSSGDPASDKAAIEAIALSAPFAALPKGLRNLPIEFSFGNEIRAGKHQVAMSDRVASQSLYNEAVGIIQKKQYAEALDRLEFALDRDPENSQISQALRYIAAYIDDSTPDNVQLLHRILALDPQQPSAKEKLKIILRSQGKDPAATTDRIALAEEAKAKGDAEGMLVEYSAANDSKAGAVEQTKIVEAYRVLAGRRMQRKWETVSRTRKDAETLCGLGRAHQLAGEYDQATLLYKQALEADNTSDMAKSLLAGVEQEQKNGGASALVAPLPVVAKHTGGGTGELISRAQILNNEGIDLLKANNFDGAIAKFREALSVDPSHEFSRKNLSVSYNNAAVKLPAKESANLYRKALYVLPDSDLARKNLRSSLLNLGMHPDSADERIKAAEDFTSSGDNISAIVELREAIMLHKNAAAEAKLTELMKQAPALP